jgi:hypothetical protein
MTKTEKLGVCAMAWFMFGMWYVAEHYHEEAWGFAISAFMFVIASGFYILGDDDE